jgi:OmcA/MtrC family decaheme c-type cytochrome
MRRTIILLLAALLLFGLQGCSDDGSDGAQGAQGEQGEPGPPGDVVDVVASGTAESGTTSTLTDIDVTWTPDEHAGREINIVAGTGSGQSREVLTNTVNTVTVSAFWDTTPDATSQYEIVSTSASASIDPDTAVEACVGCHGAGEVRPVEDITDTTDVHYVDTDPDGPLTDSGYRQVNIAISAVDVSRTTDPNSVIIDFAVTDETGAFVTNILQSDGRFSISRLNDGAIPQDPTFWQSFITRLDAGAVQATTEGFSSGTFLNNNNGTYRYNSRFDPATAPPGVAPIAANDSIRVAIQLSARDLPAGNGWCDFDASLAGSSTCGSASLTRDIVRTETCNGCHGVTSDTHLAEHGGGRTQVAYCVTCHNPGSTDGQSGNTVDFSVMLHKIHYGASLTNKPYEIIGFENRVHDYSFVNFTKDIDDCTNCHKNDVGGEVPADWDNWSKVPNRDACGSCHDDVNFDTGENHDPGGQQLTNLFCANCHPSSGNVTPSVLPVPAVHQGVARRQEGALYAGVGDGYQVDIVDYDPASRELTVEYSVTKDGTKMDLENDPEWTAPGGASRLALDVGWNTEPDYDNLDSESAPALPTSINALDVGGAVSETGPGTMVYIAVVKLPTAATAGSVTAGLEGHPAADLDGVGAYTDRIAVKNAFDSVDATPRAEGLELRRQIVDVALCNKCHDSAGNGISLHGNNRTGDIDVCVLCHTGDTTDINRRPVQPATTADGKAEETIHFRRMIHQIHNGGELEDGLFIYGFGGSVNNFSHVEFIGNLQNCETCHLPGTYSAEAAQEEGLATTIDTGADLEDPGDDLNISPAASVCSGCHSHESATDHMKLNGASFHALDDDIM